MQNNQVVSEYLDSVARTLDIVFGFPENRREEIIKKLRDERDEDFWNMALHDHPLYFSAEVAGIALKYPDFQIYEDRYAALIEKQSPRSPDTKSPPDSLVVSLEQNKEELANGDLVPLEPEIDRLRDTIARMKAILSAPDQP